MPREKDLTSLVLAKDILIEFKSGKDIEHGLLPYYPYWAMEFLSNEGDRKSFDFFEFGLEEGIFKKIIIKFFRPDDEGKEKVYKEEEWTSKSKKDHFTMIDVEFEKDENEKIKLSFFLDIDEKALKKFIDGYVLDWEKNSFYYIKGNLYRSSRQLFEVTQYLLKLLKEYVPNHLLVEDLGDLKIDFLAAMLFLEKRDFLKIIWSQDVDNVYKNPRHVLGLRIDINKSFQEAFSEDITDLNYYDYIINKEAFKKRIVFASPRQLAYNGKIHELQRQQVPYHLLQLAYRNKGEVDERELEKESGEKDEKLRKALGNFKRILRGKFELSEDEAFFFRQGNKLIFDMNLFYFLPEKVKISR